MHQRAGNASEEQNDGGNLTGELQHPQRHTKAPMIGARSSTERFFNFFVDFLILVKSMPSPENMPLSHDRVELGMFIIPEPKAPMRLKKSSTAFPVRPVRSSC